MAWNHNEFLVFKRELACGRNLKFGSGRVMDVICIIRTAVRSIEVLHPRVEVKYCAFSRVQVDATGYCLPRAKFGRREAEVLALHNHLSNLGSWRSYLTPPTRPHPSSWISSDSFHLMYSAISLVALPVEIQQEIASYLEFPDNICLRMTCRRFSSVIPPLTHDEALKAEISAFGFQRELYACSHCICLRPRRQFADRMTQFRMSKFGRNKAKRVCVECGVHGTGTYSPGSKLVWRNENYVVCTACKELRKIPTGENENDPVFCGDCWTLAQATLS